MSEQNWKPDGPIPESMLGRAVPKWEGRRTPFCSRAGGSSIFLQGNWGFPHLRECLKHGLGVSA